MPSLPVYILAGGRSSRFGSDKARALLDGEPLIARLARQIAPIAAGITVVADAPEKYADLGLRTIADRRPGLGPLAGLEAAMLDLIASTAPLGKWCQTPFPDKWCQTPFSQAPTPEGGWLAMLTCDMTGLQPAWIELLQHAARDGKWVATFHDSAGRRHPFPGLYHLDLLTAVQQRLDAGSLAVHGLIDAVDHVEIPVPADWPAVAQANTLDDLHRAARGLCSSEQPGPAPDPDPRKGDSRT